MREYLPILIVGSIIGAFSIAFILAYAAMKNKKEAVGFDRNMKDSEIVRRLLAYAKPYWKEFVLVLLIMAVSIVYDIVSPQIIGNIQEMVKKPFELQALYKTVAV